MNSHAKPEAVTNVPSAINRATSGERYRPNQSLLYLVASFSKVCASASLALAPSTRRNLLVARSRQSVLYLVACSTMVLASIILALAPLVVVTSPVARSRQYLFGLVTNISKVRASASLALAPFTRLGLLAAHLSQFECACVFG